jgi:hypothetical protein
MAANTPGCRAICEQNPSELMNDLTRVVIALRMQGASKAKADALVHDGAALSKLLGGGSMGSLRGVADSLIASGCVDCAVEKVYS